VLQTSCPQLTAQQNLLKLYRNNHSPFLKYLEKFWSVEQKVVRGKNRKSLNDISLLLNYWVNFCETVIGLSYMKIAQMVPVSGSADQDCYQS
jgi:hypothetical protein